MLTFQMLKYSEADLKKKVFETEQMLKGEMLRQRQNYVKKMKAMEQDNESLHSQIDKLTTSHEQMKCGVSHLIPASFSRFFPSRFPGLL
jgi:hypothetical protein